MNCKGARALVTGAAKRIGRAIALELADAGCEVAMHYHRSEAQAGELAERIRGMGRRALAVPGDLADPATPGALVEQVCRQFGGLEVLVNNASLFVADPTDGFDATHWESMYRVNAIAPAALIAAAEEALRASGSGKVVNLCDISAERPWGDYSAYCSSKAALVGVTKAAARKLAPHVQVNGVSPGIALFPEDYDAARRAKLAGKVPLRREGRPEDVARTVRFLVEQGDYITGQIINVDGGRSIA